MVSGPFYIKRDSSTAAAGFPLGQVSPKTRVARLGGVALGCVDAGHVVLGQGGVTMKQSPLLRFESSAFVVMAGEDEETNPGVLGKSLALWLAEELRASGFTPGEVFAEDFGWCVSIESKPHALYVACASADRTSDQWSVFAFAEGGIFARLLGKDRRAESVATLFSAVQRCLTSAPSIHNLREEPHPDS